MTCGNADILSVGANEDTDVETFTLQRVERANALNAELVDRLTLCLDKLAEAQQATQKQKLVQFRSAHRAFCAGFDLAEAEEQTEGDILLRFVRIETLLQKLRRGPVASMAVIEGAAYGAGADLAIACVWRVGTPAAKFRFPGFGFGVALGTRHLVEIVGTGKARQILFENRVVEAQEALECGLLTHLVEPEDLEETVEELSSLPVTFPTGAAERMVAITGQDSGDADLADMVRSLAEPGLKDRIARYLEASGR